MRRPKVLWASSQYWGAASHVSAHHYARLLAGRGWDVLFLSPPISPWHAIPRGSRTAFRERWQGWRADGDRDLDGRLLAYSPLTLLPPHRLPLLRRPAVLDHWARLTLPALGGFLRRHDFAAVDLLVIDTPVYGCLLDLVPHRRSVLRVVDDLSGFAGVPASWVQRERELAPRVDHVIVTAHLLAQQVAAWGPRRLTHVPNGVQLDHFFNPAHATPPTEYQTIPAPRAVYVGALEEWFDVDLLDRVAAALPAVSFVLIGTGKADLRPLRKLANVHILGRRDYAQVPAYLRHADAGLIPFRRTALIHAVNPIKLYEYMACGLPVVATDWDELRRINSPARLCDTAEEFQQALAAVLRERPAAQPLQAYARQADWQERLGLLLGAVDVAA